MTVDTEKYAFFIHAFTQLFIHAFHLRKKEQ